MITREFTDIEKQIISNVGCKVEIVGIDGNIKGINLGLYFPEVWTSRGRLIPNGINVFFEKIGEHKNKVYVQNYNQVKLLL